MLTMWCLYSFAIIYIDSKMSSKYWQLEYRSWKANVNRRWLVFGKESGWVFYLRSLSYLKAGISFRLFLFCRCLRLRVIYSVSMSTFRLSPLKISRSENSSQNVMQMDAIFFVYKTFGFFHRIIVSNFNTESQFVDK